MHLYFMKRISNNYFVIILVLCLALSSNLFAQFDKEKFEEIFNEETSQDDKYSSRESHSNLYTHVPAQTIPQWVYAPPVSSSGSIVALGISDPGLDSTDAFQMATYRACVMANILHKNTTQLLCDFFLNEVLASQQIVYEHFSRIITQMPDSVSSYNILETYTNAFDETFVLIEYNPFEKRESLNLNTIFFELYKNETEHGLYGGYESIYELLVKRNGNKYSPMMYQLTEYGPRNSVVGSIYGIDYEVPIYSLSYNYQMADSVTKFHLSHGIWKEYFKSTTNYILSVAREKPENIKVMGDNNKADYNQSDSYEKLTRGLSVNKLAFVFEGIRVTNDQLSVSLREVPIVFSQVSKSTQDSSIIISE